MKIVNRYSKQFLLLLIVFLTLTPLNVLAETNNYVELNYVALGDSLAAGYLNDSSLPLGKGYPIFIQEGIEENLVYNVDLKNRGVGGYTTINVLEQVTTNDEVRNDIANANLITLNIGANDLLGAVGDLENLDPNDEEAVAETLKNVNIAFDQIEKNLDVILNEIKILNEEATIYIMGYYNALHYLEGETLQELTSTVMGILNNTMENYGEKYGAYYVPTFKAFEGKYDEFLPKPDIHPNEAGYEVIGNLFLDQIIPNLGEVETPDTQKPIITLIGDDPLTLEVGDTYDEPGATAVDDVDGDITDAIEILGEVDISIEDTYKVIYTVSDIAGNEATKTRVVNVVEAVVEPEAPVDKSALEEKITEFVGLKATDYTGASWNTFDEALTAANDVVTNENATQASVDEVLAALITAQADLEKAEVPADPVDKSTLEERITEIEELEATNYTEASWNTFEKALAAANAVLIVEDATQASVDEVLAALITAQDGLEEAEVLVTLGDKGDKNGKSEAGQEDQVVVKNDKETEPAIVGGSDGGTTNKPGILPYTVTSNPLLIVIGAGLSLLGGAFVFIHRKLVL